MFDFVIKTIHGMNHSKGIVLNFINVFINKAKQNTFTSNAYQFNAIAFITADYCKVIFTTSVLAKPPQNAVTVL